MVRSHKTKNGETMAIVAMGDSHLLNTIGLYVRKMEQMTGIKAVDPAVRSMYADYGTNFERLGLREQDRYQAIREMALALEPYIAELFMRENLLRLPQCEELRAQLGHILKRSEAKAYSIEEEKRGWRAIASSRESIEDDFEWDDDDDDNHHGQD
jgi:hypothetical protein